MQGYFLQLFVVIRDSNENKAQKRKENYICAKCLKIMLDFDGYEIDLLRESRFGQIEFTRIVSI